MIGVLLSCVDIFDGVGGGLFFGIVALASKGWSGYEVCFGFVFGVASADG